MKIQVYYVLPARASTAGTLKGGLHRQQSRERPSDSTYDSVAHDLVKTRLSNYKQKGN